MKTEKKTGIINIIIDDNLILYIIGVQLIIIGHICKPVLFAIILYTIGFLWSMPFLKKDKKSNKQDQNSEKGDLEMLDLIILNVVIPSIVGVIIALIIFFIIFK